MTAHKVMYRGYEVPENLLGHLFGGLNAWKQGVDTVLGALAPCVPHSEPAGTLGLLIKVSVYGLIGHSVDSPGVWLVDEDDRVWYRTVTGRIEPAITSYTTLMDQVPAIYCWLGSTEIPLPN